MEKKTLHPKENTLTKPLQSTPRLKVVVRYLPPNLSEEIFKESTKTWLTEECVEWFSFFPGKVSSNRSKNDKYARAYIKFKSFEALIAFYKGFNGHLFQYEKRKIFIEFAPFQKIPRLEERKHDIRQGTIDGDAEFIAFQESLKNPKSPQGQVQNKQEDDDVAPINAITPLIEYLRAQKEAAALKSKQQQRKYASEKKLSSKTKADTTTHVKTQGGSGFSRKFNKHKNQSQKEMDNPDARKESSMRLDEIFPDGSSNKKNNKNPLKKDSSVVTNAPVKILKASNRNKPYGSETFNKEKKYDSSQSVKKNNSPSGSSTNKTENETRKNTRKYHNYSRPSLHREAGNNTESFSKPDTFRAKGNEHHFTKNYRNKVSQE
ncbi:hypothetical protein PCK1_002689 [Pneumocystis canis]|nr:hypothetical protein PCK1_002689 [Pneumocystis canis]